MAPEGARLVTMPAPLASVHARFATPTGREVHVATDGGALAAADDGSAGSPRSLLLGALAACTALAARTHLERGGDPGDVEVVVTMEAGPEPVLYRRVLLGVESPGTNGTFVR